MSRAPWLIAGLGDSMVLLRSDQTLVGSSRITIYKSVKKHSAIEQMSQTRAQLVKGFSNTSASDDAVTVDSSGRVLVATTTSNANAGADDLQIGDRTASTERGITIGSTAGGGIRFADAGSTNAGIVEYQHSSNNLRFYTDATERVQISGNGTIKLISSGGIDFSGIQTNTAGMTSETLDSYEEGTFTPVFANSNTGGTESSSYTNQVGRYTKIGNLVHIDIYLSNVVSSGLGTSQFFIRGLPFSIQSGSIHIGTAGLSQVDLNSAASGLYSFANASTGAISSIRVFQAKDNTGHSAIPCDAVNSGTNEIFISMTYPTA